MMTKTNTINASTAQIPPVLLVATAVAVNPATDTENHGNAMSPMASSSPPPATIKSSRLSFEKSTIPS
jgi:hypothetical protein